MSVIKIIEQAIKDGATELDLSKKGLTRLPPGIDQLTNLTSLSLNENQLSMLPPAIGQLTNLTTLDLSRNQLSTLPLEIGQLTNLAELDLNVNLLLTLPPELCQLTSLTRLGLSWNKLSTLPPEICQLTNLTTLDLSHNRLSTMPVQLTHLTTLDLSHNRLSEIPAQIVQLTNLTTLDLSHNRLSTLPPEMEQLINLTALDLRNNPLSISARIFARTNKRFVIYRFKQIKFLAKAKQDKVRELDLSEREITVLSPKIGKLTHLVTLNLTRNQLSKLPLEIGQLSELISLDLSHNELSALPSEIGQLSELTSLTLSHNQLSTLPPEISSLTHLIELDLTGNQLNMLPLEIGQLTNLAKLDLRNNQLSTLPSEIGQLTNLAKLDLRNNQLSTLPSEIGQLTNLAELDLRGNLLAIPPEVLEHTNEPTLIIGYYLREQKKPLNEAKLVLVGQGGVGKTSLAKRLVEDEFNKDEPITEGINIKLRSVTINDQIINFNIWDFGGQEIMHATHQFFLTQRTLYLLVLDARQGEVSSRLDYWLNLIRSFAGNSPIIVVSNKVDQHPSALNQRELKKKYPDIKAFVDTSCKTSHGLAELQRHITAVIDKLEHVRDLVPVQWLGLKRVLEKRKENYITYSEYLRLCETSYIRDEQEQRILIRLLHDLGVVLHFEDDTQLRQIIVLNPEWVTGAVYQIINAKQLQNKGVLDIEQLDEILDTEIYPKEQYLFIIKMMRRFKRCFDLEGYVGEKFLLPDLLPIQGPSLHFLPSNSLDFEYHYNFLPHTLISRFMIQMHGFIFGDNYWLTGVMLVKDKNNALVRAVPEDKKMVISIIGPLQGRRKFLTDIRIRFEQIHQTISNLKAVEHVVHEQVAIPYSDLETLYKQGVKDHLFLDSNGELVIANVPELLDSVKREFSRQKDTAIKGILEQLREQLHPQLFYPGALQLGQDHYLTGAYTLARQLLAIAHQTIRAWRGMESKYESQIKLTSKSAKLYKMLVHCCAEEQNNFDKLNSAFDKAFEYAAIGKGRAFVKKLADVKLDFEVIDNQKEFAEKLKQARKLRSEINQRQKEASKNQEDENQRGELYKLFQQEIELWKEMEREYPRLTATLSVPTLLAAQARDLAKELGATLVEYYRHGSNNASGWCAFVVTSDEIRYISLSKLNKQFLKRLLKWRNHIHLPAGRSPFMDQRLAELYDAAIAPLDLKDERVIIAPFEHLHLLPLAAAYNRKSKRYLAQDHLLSFVPSLTALYVSKQGVSQKKGGLSEKSIKRLLSVAYPGSPEDYLPNVLDEANAIVERVSIVATVDELHEEAATRNEVLKRAPNYDVIHFGCHGNFNSEKPTESGLLLAEKRLTVQDIIMSLNLKQTRLVTLAACLTGQVALRQGEEHIGLLQAMMTAGVQTVVASLWSVDDTATRALFTAFYTREVNINAPAQAMRDAAALLREDEEWKEKWAHPYYWAAFQVNGLTLPVEEITEAEWGIEMREQIKDDYQRSIQRGLSMKDQLFVENAELLLENMLSDNETLAVLKKQPLPNEIAQLPIEHTPLGVADAIHYIVLSNPTLRQRFLPPSVRDIEQIKAQLKELRGRVTEEIQKETENDPDWHKEQPGLQNDVRTVRRVLLNTLETTNSPCDEEEDKDQQNDTVWNRFMALLGM